MPKATAKTKHIEHKAELIELLLTEPVNPNNVKGNPVLAVDKEKPIGFAEKFSLLLYETPRIGSTADPEFFIHGILGSVLTLSESGLVKKLGINKVYVKHTMKDVEYVQGNKKIKGEADVVKLCFSFEKDGKKQIALRVFVNDEITDDNNPEGKYRYSDDELKEIAEELGISDKDNINVDEHVFRIRTEGELGNKSFRLHKWQIDGVKNFKAAASSQSQINNEFKEISIAQSVNLEDSFKKLSDKDIKKVIGGTEKIFEKFASVYQDNQKEFSLSNSEAASHGFYYGALALNCKYRYGLNCYAERTVGKGRADLIFMSRTKDASGRINPKPAPIVVEFKRGGHTADKAVVQIKNKGYLYNLGIRTKAEEAVIVGISKGGGLKVEKGDIFQSRGFIRQILGEARRFNQNSIDRIRDILKGELRNLYYSIQSNDRYYLSRLVLGQVLALNDDGLAKHIFTYADQDESMEGEATTFVLSNQGKAVILNIIEQSGEQRRLRGQEEFDSNKIPPIDELDIDSAVKFDVTISTGVWHKPNGFEIEGEKGKSYYQSINVEEVSGSSQDKFQGQFKKIKNVKVGNLVEGLQKIKRTRGDKKRSEEKLRKLLSPLAEALFPFMRAVGKEIYFRAIWQGLFVNGKTKNDKEIGVYTEFNASSLGRMDLGLSFTKISQDDGSLIEDEPIIIELKLAGSGNGATGKLKQAEEQMDKKYTILRSFTNKKTANHLAMVFNNRAENENSLIMASMSNIDVYHTTSGSSPEKSSTKRSRSPLAGCSKRRRIRNVGVLCIDSRDEESIEEKERKEEVMKELFGTDKMRERAKSIEFYDQLFRISQQISEGEIIDKNVEEAFVAKIKDIDLDSIDPEIRDIVKEMKDNIENKEEVKNILRRPGVAEKIGKVAEDAGLAFTVFLIGKHIANGNIEGLGYDALNLWVMPKIGEKISGKILELGTKLDSQMLKGFAPVMGRAIGNFAAFLGLAESIKARQSATDPADIKIADLNIATNSIFIAVDVPAVVTETMSAIGMEAGIMGEFAGPVGAAVSVAVIIISQFVEASLEVEKLEEHINLTDQEKHDLYWDFFLGKKVPDYIEDDIEAEQIYRQYLSNIIGQYKDNYDKIVMSLPHILVTKESRGDAKIQLFRSYCHINTKIVDTKFDFGFNTNVTYPFHISGINSRVVPTNIESYSVVCGPRDSDVKVQVDNLPCTDCVVNGIGSGCDNLYNHSNILLNRTFEKWFLQEYSSGCYNAVVYRNKNSRGYGSIYYILAQNASINVVFQGKDVPNDNRDRRDKIENRYYFEKSLDSCKVHNPGRNFFYIAGKFSCDLGADGQKNIVITQGNFTTDSMNIHSIIGSNRTNYLEFFNADYVDGKGGNDVITTKNFTTIKGYFGDSIYGKGLVLLPINLSDIGNITHANNITNIYNKSGDFISVDKQILVKTADGLFVTPTKVDTNTGRVTNLQIMQLNGELDNLQKIDNSNFNITKQLSSADYHSTIGGSSNHIFYPDKEHHNFYWEAPTNVSHLYLFDQKNANITIAQANGILDFSQLNCTLDDMPFTENNAGEIKINKNGLHVTLLPDYKDVTVTFDGEEYYKFQNGELERDYCSHNLRIDGRFSVNGTDLLNHHNCFMFDSDKVLFLKLNNDLLLLSDRGALSISDYYSSIHKNWDLSIRLNNRIVEPKGFRERANKFSSFRYYKPDEQGLQIYHNQPVNKNDIGLVDLKDKSILNLDMKVTNDTLLLSYKNNALVKVENWNTYQPAKEIMFAFNDAVISNSKCIVSTCNAEDIIVDFNKEKVILLKKRVFNAIAQDNIDKVKHLIRSTNFEGGGELRYLYLTIIAIQMGRLHSLRTLFNRGYFSIRDKDICVLHWAIRWGKLDIAKFLIDQGADIESRNAYNERPLHLAVKAGSLGIVKLLFSKGANVNATDMYGQTPLGLAIRRNYRDIVEFLRQAQLDLDRELSNAAQGSCSGKIKSLVSRGANINAKDNDGNTFLHNAAWIGRLGVVKCLIVNGANMNVKNNRNLIPLQVVGSNSNIERVLRQVHLDEELLLTVKSEKGLKTINDLIAESINGDKDRNGAYYFAWSDNLDTVRFLVERGVNVNATDKYGCTLLHWAALKGHSKVAQFLVGKGANVNAKDILGRTPIHFATMNNHLDLVRFFTNEGANMNAKDENGKTPLDIAEENLREHSENEECSDVVQCLEKLNQGRGGTVQRKRRHHHGDHSRRKPLAIDQPEIAASSGTRPSSWINDLVDWVKNSIGRLLSPGPEEVSNITSPIPQRENILNSTSTTLPSDSTGQKQEGNYFTSGDFFQDNVDYVNANLKQSHERQIPFKFEPKGGNTILEMGDHYLSQADSNGTIMLLDLLIRKVTGQKYISTVDQPISSLEAQGYALNIIEKFEKVLNETAIKSGISVTNLNFDPVAVQSAIVGQIISEKFSEISKTLYSFAKEACPEFKQTDKFLAHLRSSLEGEKEAVLLQQKVEKPSKILDQQISRRVELSKKPDTFLNGTSVVKGISSVLEL